jgi:pectate lyase
VAEVIVSQQRRNGMQFAAGRFAAFLLVISASFGGTCCGQENADSLPAFPGAEGFGAVSKGGRGGKVIKVTTLKPTGPGSFSAAMSAKGPRIIVFEVSGVIPAGPGKHGGYKAGDGTVTIAGQTAPGPGIAIEGKLDFHNCQDIIVRHLRVRFTGQDGADSGLFVKCDRVMLDHLSISWGADESLSLVSTRNATVQCTTIEASRLCWEGGDEPHNFAMIISGGPSTLNRVLFAHHHTRAAEAQKGIVLDYRNNVVYNLGAGIRVPPGGGNMVNNYLKHGPGALFGMPRIYHSPTTLTKAGLFLAKKLGHVYLAGNFLTYDGGYYELAHRNVRARYKKSAGKPLPCPPMTTRVAEEAYQEVTACSGALPRDEITAQCIYEVRSGTGLWDERFPRGDWRARMAGGKAPADADQDGMPDQWEKANKLNPGDHTDAGKLVPVGASPGDRHKGYTYIEYYINQRADILEAQALTLARLRTSDGQEAPREEWKALPKSVDQLVADIDMQNMELHKSKLTDTHATWRAIWALKASGPKAAPAAVKLVEVMKTDDNRKALFVAWALGVIAPFADGKKVVPVLIERLEHPYPIMGSKWRMNPQGFIAWALGRFGPSAKAAVPVLAKTLHHKNGEARQPAAWALSQIGKDAAPATDALVKALGYAGGSGWYAKGDCRYYAARALASIGESTVPALSQALVLQKKGDELRLGVVMALRLLGPKAKLATSGLITALGDKDPLVRGEAALALSAVNPQADGVVSALVGALADADYGVRNNVAKALGQCGPAARNAVPALERALKDEKKEIRRTAALALGGLGKHAIAALKKALSADDPLVRKYASRALGNIGEGVAGGVDALTQALADKDAEVRREAVWSLTLIGPAAKGAAGVLKKANTTDADYVVRYAAGEALKRIEN